MEIRRVHIIFTNLKNYPRSRYRTGRFSIASCYKHTSFINIISVFKGQGNIEDGSAAEFNFHFDPEAAYMVLHELNCPITTFSWEAVLQNQYSWVCKGLGLNII